MGIVGQAKKLTIIIKVKQCQSSVVSTWMDDHPLWKTKDVWNPSPCMWDQSASHRSGIRMTCTSIGNHEVAFKYAITFPEVWVSAPTGYMSWKRPLRVVKRTKKKGFNFLIITELLHNIMFRIIKVKKSILPTLLIYYFNLIIFYHSQSSSIS